MNTINNMQSLRSLTPTRPSNSDLHRSKSNRSSHSHKESNDVSSGSGIMFSQQPSDDVYLSYVQSIGGVAAIQTMEPGRSSSSSERRSGSSIGTNSIAATPALFVPGSPLLARHLNSDSNSSKDKDRFVIDAPPPPSAATLRAIPRKSNTSINGTPMNRTQNQSVPISLSRSNTRQSIASDTMTIATNASSLSRESMASVKSSGSTYKSMIDLKSRFRATSHDSGVEHIPVPRPSMASISTAGFMEVNDPQLSLRFLLNQPNTMFGVVKREQPSHTFLGRNKSKFNPYITVLYNDKLIAYHASGKEKLLRPDTMNGPFYSAGSTIHLKNNGISGDYSRRSSATTPNPTFSSNSMHAAPRSILRLTTESEIHVSEKGIYVLKVTGKKIDNTADVAAMTAASSISLEFDILEDKTWLMQFENPDSMMEWMARIKRLIADMAAAVALAVSMDAEGTTASAADVSSVWL
ncbi:UNVERIFIED_CONTAM: hypothetical protein HDU68_010382 [Siphonaria sp. JEL0065]|nr:hypothetical protein HDU68_010382 [Siphonaria sp. JEL0065]